MKNDNIRIKRKNSDYLIFGILFLLMILVGIFMICIPFLPFAPESTSVHWILYIAGGLIALVGCVLFGFSTYRALRPADALVLTNKGFTNLMLGGKEGVFIEWTNISSMKIYGLSKSPMLGISLENNDRFLASLTNAQIREARTNLEIGLPILSIAQRDVFVPINELKNLFSRMIKGAISWENYTSQTKKPDQTHTLEQPIVSDTSSAPVANIEEVFRKPKKENTFTNTIIQPIVTPGSHFSDDASASTEQNSDPGVS